MSTDRGAAVVTPVIETEGLTRRFGRLTAVDTVDLRIRRGTIFGFLGPNGSGKTTTIRMLAGLLWPSEGRIRVLDLDIPAKAEALKARIGYMTQRFSLYEDLSVLENLRFIAEIYALPRPRVRARLDELLEAYYLADMKDQRAGTLSGGQRQRLALAAATLHGPELLFLDEPTSAVDPQSRRDFWDKLFTLADAGTTILVSTHYMDEAERCHELAIMQRGAIAVSGPPERLKSGLDAQVVQVDTDNPHKAAQSLNGQASVIGVTQIGNMLRVQLQVDRRDGAGFVREALAETGLTGNCRRVEPNLEDVFVIATGPGGRQA